MTKILRCFCTEKWKSTVLQEVVSRRNSHSYSYNPNKTGDIIENYQTDIMTIGINLPETRNEMSKSSVEKLCQLIKKFEEDDNIPVAIIHGIGGTFCKGSSLTFTEECEYIQKLSNIKKPIIASIDGYATNFGFGLALMCDFRIVEDTALIGLGDGMYAEGTSSLICEKLVAIMGLSKALELLLCARPLSAKEAYECHLSSKYTECGTALGQAINMARCISKFPKERILKDRQTLYSISSRLKQHNDLVV